MPNDYQLAVMHCQLPETSTARKARAVSLLNNGSELLDTLEALMLRARVELVEFKRTGSRERLPELIADIARLKCQVERL